MARLTLADLAPYPRARKAICNGAGPKGWGWLVPDLWFTKPADGHDLSYWVGNRAIDKLCGDVMFYVGCLQECLTSGLGFWKALLRLFLSHVYFVAVALGGWFCFHWGSKRTIADVKVLERHLAWKERYKEN